MLSPSFLVFFFGGGGGGCWGMFLGKTKPDKQISN